MLRDAFLLATVAVLVGCSTVLHTPTFFYSPVFRQAPTIFHTPVSLLTQQLRPVTVVLRGREGSLPCPAAGFYQHPTNCSRFYRCVDYLETGNYFSRYVFECPTGNVFTAGASTCVPGNCNRSVPTATPDSSTQPTDRTPDQSTVAPIKPTTLFSVPPTTEFSVPPTTEFSVPPTTEFSVPPTTDLPAPSTTEPPAEGGEAEVGVTELPGQVVNVPNTTVTETSTPSPVTPTTDAPTTQSCTPQYVQHPSYCNVYVQCNNSKLLFVCPLGTAFDELRQMCRISAADESLCVGKAILQVSFLRTEVVDGHIQLPESFELPPVDTLSLRTKTRTVVAAFPNVPRLVPPVGFLHHPQVHLPNSFTYLSHRRKRIA
ncbi:uncharacterized protein Fnta isoform X1 [Panulirus ornatus]|uniref:uncharacterized protein Fnta isoform X1 n=1 Tax=Panulirus ornatus TaxID=150431 RepID=UPI003A871475